MAVPVSFPFKSGVVHPAEIWDGLVLPHDFFNHWAFLLKENDVGEVINSDDGGGESVVHRGVRLFDDRYSTGFDEKVEDVDGRSSDARKLGYCELNDVSGRILDREYDRANLS